MLSPKTHTNNNVWTTPLQPTNIRKQICLNMSQCTLINDTSQYIQLELPNINALQTNIQYTLYDVHAEHPPCTVRHNMAMGCRQKQTAKSVHCWTRLTHIETNKRTKHYVYTSLQHQQTAANTLQICNAIYDTSQYGSNWKGVHAMQTDVQHIVKDVHAEPTVHRAAQHPWMVGKAKSQKAHTAEQG